MLQASNQVRPAAIHKVIRRRVSHCCSLPGGGKPASGSRSSSLNSAASIPQQHPQQEGLPSVRHASQQSAQDEDDYFEEDTSAVCEGKPHGSAVHRQQAWQSNGDGRSIMQPAGALATSMRLACLQFQRNPIMCSWGHSCAYAQQVPEDGFAAQPFQPASTRAPPPPKRSTKLLSIGNLADVDATLLAGRGPSVRWGFTASLLLL